MRFWAARFDKKLGSRTVSVVGNIRATRDVSRKYREYPANDRVSGNHRRGRPALGVDFKFSKIADRSTTENGFVFVLVIRGRDRADMDVIHIQHTAYTCRPIAIRDFAKGDDVHLVGREHLANPFRFGPVSEQDVVSSQTNTWPTHRT